METESVPRKNLTRNTICHTIICYTVVLLAWERGHERSLLVSIPRAYSWIQQNFTVSFTSSFAICLTCTHTHTHTHVILTLLLYM